MYEPPSKEDGYRILVDRLWPRGISKEKARIDEWRKDLAPSDALRKWFAHDPKKWDEFRERYRAELQAAGKWSELRTIAERAMRENVTLVYSAKDERHNQAVALQEIASGT